MYLTILDFGFSANNYCFCEQRSQKMSTKSNERFSRKTDHARSKSHPVGTALKRIVTE